MEYFSPNIIIGYKPILIPINGQFSNTQAKLCKITAILYGTFIYELVLLYAT